MRWTDVRIRKLSKEMARQLASRGSVKLAGTVDSLADLITRTLILDQEFEEQIEAEAREMLSRQRNLPPPGTGQYQAAFQQAKRAAAARRGIKYD